MRGLLANLACTVALAVALLGLAVALLGSEGPSRLDGLLDRRGQEWPGSLELSVSGLQKAWLQVISSSGHGQATGSRQHQAGKAFLKRGETAREQPQQHPRQQSLVRDHNPLIHRLAGRGVVPQHQEAIRGPAEFWVDEEDGYGDNPGSLVEEQRDVLEAEKTSSKGIGRPKSAWEADEERHRQFLKHNAAIDYKKMAIQNRKPESTKTEPAAWLKRPLRVVAPLRKPGRGSRCPVMFKKGPDGACSVSAPGLQGWCLTPMQIATGARYARIPLQKDKRDFYKTYTEATGPQPVFETFLRHRDIPNDLKLDHFLIHKGNKFDPGYIWWALRTASPRADFVSRKDLPDLFDFSTCAIVGSSASLLKSKFGAEIDAHSFVMRFNQAPVKGFEGRVGSKTSLRLQNQERTGHVPGDKSNYCLVKGYNFRHNGKCIMLPLSPQFMLYTKYFWFMNRPSHMAMMLTDDTYKVSNVKMSTGMMGLALALHLCGQVDLYGFSGSRGHYYRKSAAAKSDATPFAQRHPWQIEKACVRHMSEKMQDVHVRI